LAARRDGQVSENWKRFLQGGFMVTWVLLGLAIAFWVLLFLVIIQKVPFLVIRTKKQHQEAEETHARAYQGAYDNWQAADKSHWSVRDIAERQADQISQLKRDLERLHQEHVKLQNTDTHLIERLQKQNYVLDNHVKILTGENAQIKERISNLYRAKKKVKG
jgi:Na+-transporting methylmalonyl-CoA/oxaloacetate decarboxylase gamma subunit